MFEAGDMKEKALLALAVNVPMRINDYNELLKSDITPYLDATEFPIYFVKVTKKSKTPMPCFITEETMKLLRVYVKNLRDDNPYLWQGRGKKKLDEDSINRTLKNLVKTADINTMGLRVRFHLFRKTFIGVARSMIGLSDDQVKMLTGKRVKADMDPYYARVELRPLFTKVAERLRLTGYADTGNQRLDSIEQVINLILDAFKDTLKEKVEKLWTAKWGQFTGTPSTGLGFIIQKPDFDKMPTKELLKQYQKLTVKTDENAQR
jgi:hypothetical protein